MDSHLRNAAAAPLTAEQFVEMLGAAHPAAWRRAALAVEDQAGLGEARAELESALGDADRARLWFLEDDVESALYRLTTHEAAGVVHGSREFHRICLATRHAAEALACDALSAAARQLLVGPFLALRGPGDVTPPG
jgi:hypothetical protein